MEIIFVRHGEPGWGVQGVNVPNPELTSRGHEQAQRAARRLAEGPYPPTEILVSPRTRSMETAAPLVEITGIAAQTVLDLEEIRMPDWTGRPEEEVQRIFAAARHRPVAEWWDGLPGGESFHAFHDRVSAAMTAVLADRGVRPAADGGGHLWEVEEKDHRDHRIAVVAHAGTNSTALSYLLGIEPTPWEWERFILGHASIARVRTIPLVGSHVFSLRAFNDQEHLPKAIRTR
ncbi:MAG: histidine phosphatase family protein [Acidimicrobiia bacterium]